MKLLKIMLIVFAISLLVGCANVKQEKETFEDVKGVDEVQKDEKIEGGIETKADENIRDDNALKDNNLEELKKLIKLSDNSRIFPKSKKLKVGDSYQYMFALTNPSNSKSTWYSEIEFMNAKSTGLSNNILADKKVMLNWIKKPIVGETTVKSGDVKYIPINIEVKDLIGNDMKTQSGSYTFRVVTYDNETVSWDRADWKEFHSVKFTIFVS